MDSHQEIQKKYMNKWFISIMSGLVIFVFMLIFIFSEIQRSKHSDELALAATYSAFQSETISLVYDDITLLKGYLTFIETNDMNEDTSTEYLDRLTGSNNNHYISISVIEDTTIKWIYPKVGNEDAVGVDLASVSGQREAIEHVKKNRQPILDGPIDLVQGGSGYVARLPIVETDGSYWGQMSIVLDAEALVEEIEEVAFQKGINVHIVSLDNGQTIIENSDVLSGSYLKYQFVESYFHWEVYVVPVEGWDVNWLKILILLLISFIASCGITYSVYYGLKANENLKILASKDSLTDLYNRHFLEDYQALVLSRADRYRRNVGFILMDLDRFKNINDTYGHKVGDEVLRITADILKLETRSNEAAFRLGGDEFLVLFPDLKDSDELHIVESRLTQAFAKKFNIANHDIQIMPSIGTGVYPRDGADFDQVLQVADMKMYKNKENKK